MLDTAATFAGIHNENEFYSHHYLAEIFSGDIRSVIARWRDSAANGGSAQQAPYDALRGLAGDYVRFRSRFRRGGHPARIQRQRDWASPVARRSRLLIRTA